MQPSHTKLSVSIFRVSAMRCPKIICIDRAASCAGPLNRGSPLNRRLAPNRPCRRNRTLDSSATSQNIGLKQLCFPFVEQTHDRDTWELPVVSIMAPRNHTLNLGPPQLLMGANAIRTTSRNRAAPLPPTRFYEETVRRSPPLANITIT